MSHVGRSASRRVEHQSIPPDHLGLKLATLRKEQADYISVKVEGPISRSTIGPDLARCRDPTESPRSRASLLRSCRELLSYPQDVDPVTGRVDGIRVLVAQIRRYAVAQGARRGTRRMFVGEAVDGRADVRDIVVLAQEREIPRRQDRHRPLIREVIDDMVIGVDRMRILHVGASGGPRWHESERWLHDAHIVASHHRHEL